MQGQDYFLAGGDGFVLAGGDDFVEEEALSALAADL